ncbi:hypothetical protein MCOR29_010882 [Pyricularia oryzae]|nr:hypothetical protein MCOR29_010882 [Pyricularia oryzae]KAI6412519.1 hypothetical protein MCOR24_006735 [Pyricularia oryzae]
MTCLPVAEKKKKKKEKRSWLAMLPYLFFLFCSHRCPGGGPSGFLFFKYHSIHADRAAEATIVPDSQNPLRNAKTETNEPQSPPNGTRGDGETIQEQAKPTSGCPEGSGVNDQQHGGALSSPISVLGSVKDEGLKSLLMSWYYAGYYTGLYEGQQQRDPGKVNPDRR